MEATEAALHCVLGGCSPDELWTRDVLVQCSELKCQKNKLSVGKATEVTVHCVVRSSWLHAEPSASKARAAEERRTYAQDSGVA